MAKRKSAEAVLLGLFMYTSTLEQAMGYLAIAKEIVKQRIADENPEPARRKKKVKVAPAQPQTSFNTETMGG